MKNRKILSAVVTAALLVGSVTPSTVFAESAWTSGSPAPASNGGISTQAMPSKEPVGYGSLSLTKIADDVYGVTVTPEQIKSLAFSPADVSITRGDGYHVGFHVDALDVSEGGTATYQRANTYVANLDTATIKGITTYSNGSSTDGQFWTGYQYSWLANSAAVTGGKPYLVYAIKATIGSETIYYYIAANCADFVDDFAFENPCNKTHTADARCTVCGQIEKVKIEDTTAADANGSITITDKTGAEVTEAAKDDKITITVAPDTGYALDELKINGTAVAADKIVGNAYEHTMEGSATTVEATFVAVEYAITNETTDTNGNVTIKKGDTAVSKAIINDQITVTVTPGEGYELDTLTVGGEDVTAAVTEGSYTFTMPAKEVAVTATFKETVVAVESVTLEPTTAEVEAGKTVALTATVTPDTATDKTVTWTSDEPEVATVDENGTVTGVAAGTATITATAGEKSATCKVTVTAAEVPCTSITLEKTAEVMKGKTVALKATAAPEGTTDKLTWSSSDEKIATVTADGTVTGVARGTATITATCGKITATCEISVNEEEIITPAAPKTFTETAADGTKSENVVQVLSAAEVSTAKSVTVTVTSSDGKWKATKEITKCYKTVKHTAADGTTDTLSAGDDYMIAVHVTGIPEGVTISYSFTFNK